MPPSWEESEGPDLWGTQDTGIPAPPLLLLPNNILVLSELQMETPASVILLRRGCTDIRDHRTFPTQPGSAGGSPRGCPVLWLRGTGGPRLCVRGASLWASPLPWILPHWCRTGDLMCAAGSPAPCQGSLCPGTPAFCLAQRVMDGWTDGRRRSWSCAGIPAVHLVAGYRHTQGWAVNPTTAHPSCCHYQHTGGVPGQWAPPCPPWQR